MNQLLSLSFLPFFLSCFTRACLASLSGDGLLDVASFSQGEIVVYAISAMLMCVFIWHVFIRASCPRCESYTLSKTASGMECVDCGNRWSSRTS